MTNVQNDHWSFFAPVIIVAVVGLLVLSQSPDTPTGEPIRIRPGAREGSKPTVPVSSPTIITPGKELSPSGEKTTVPPIKVEIGKDITLPKEGFEKFKVLPVLKQEGHKQPKEGIPSEGGGGRTVVEDKKKGGKFCLCSAKAYANIKGFFSEEETARIQLKPSPNALKISPRLEMGGGGGGPGAPRESPGKELRHYTKNDNFDIQTGKVSVQSNADGKVTWEPGETIHQIHLYTKTAYGRKSEKNHELTLTGVNDYSFIKKADCVAKIDCFSPCFNVAYSKYLEEGLITSVKEEGNAKDFGKPEEENKRIEITEFLCKGTDGGALQ